MRAWRRGLAWAAVAAGGWVASSCAPSGFADETLVQTVRLLASGADKPYATPGSSVNVTVLAYDGRPTQAEPMEISWIPIVCKNPTDDAYYACIQQILAPDGGVARLLGGDDGGEPEGGLPPIDAFLPHGPTFTVPIAQDVVSTHTAVAGSPTPYGLSIVFNAVCAGHLQLLPFDPGNDNPQQVPLGCFDSSGNQLGPDDWVFGFTRIYSFEPDAGPGSANANPVISSIDAPNGGLAVTLSSLAGPDGGTVDVPVYTTPTLTTTHCAASRRSDCPKLAIGPVVPQSSWEVTQQTDSNGNPENEEIWADFYSTFGQFTGDASLLYDATKGSIGDPGVTDNQFLPPNDPGSGFIWIVVHDNRGGASWVTIPVQVN